MRISSWSNSIATDRAFRNQGRLAGIEVSPRIPRKYHRGHVANVKWFTPHNAAKRNMIALAALVFPWPGGVGRHREHYDEAA
jgi:hypothetical protein